MPVSKSQTPKNLKNNYKIFVNNAPTIPAVKQNKFSHSTNKTRASVDSIQEGKRDVSNRMQK